MRFNRRNTTLKSTVSKGFIHKKNTDNAKKPAPTQKTTTAVKKSC